MNTAYKLDETVTVEAPKLRYPSISNEATVLSDIYQETCNLAVWQRSLDTSFLQQLDVFVQAGGKLNLSKQISAQSIEQDIANVAIGEAFSAQLQVYIGQLIDMFCCLFDAKIVGLRISTLDKAMCPRFHVDRVPCRLVTAFYGSGSQWLANETDIHTLDTGDVAMMKGERWQDNENAGLVHRSPPVAAGERRIVMTLDLVD